MMSCTAASSTATDDRRDGGRVVNICGRGGGRSAVGTVLFGELSTDGNGQDNFIYFVVLAVFVGLLGLWTHRIGRDYAQVAPS